AAPPSPKPSPSSTPGWSPTSRRGAATPAGSRRSRPSRRPSEAEQDDDHADDEADADADEEVLVPTNLHRTRELGQSIWLDNIRRGLITSGELGQLVEAGILGITSNPTIFEKAISGSHDYDSALRDLVAAGRGPTEIYEALALEDIRGACDVLAPAFRSSEGVDGRVSLEVLPELAANTAQTIS